jgi:putative SOS response-associated peptidase YedK
MLSNRDVQSCPQPREPETLIARFGASAGWLAQPEADGQPVQPGRGNAAIARLCGAEEGSRRGLDVMSWDVLGGAAAWPMRNVRNLGLKQWQALAAKPEKRCLIPLTEFCERTPEGHDLGDGKKPVKGEMWFDVTDQDVFAIAGFWQHATKGAGFAMVTCDPNELVAPIHPRAMITILHEDAWERGLIGSYADVVALQQPYSAEPMTVRGPLFPTRHVRVRTKGDLHQQRRASRH